MLWNLGGFNPANMAPAMLNASVTPGLTHPNLTSEMMLAANPGGIVPNNGVPVPPATGAMAPPVAPPITPTISNAAAKGDMLAANSSGDLFGNGRPREAGVMPVDAAVGGAGGMMSRVGSALSGIKPSSGGDGGQKIYSPRAPEPSQRIDQGQLLQLVMSQMPRGIPGILGGR